MRAFGLLFLLSVLTVSAFADVPQLEPIDSNFWSEDNQWHVKPKQYNTPQLRCDFYEGTSTWNATGWNAYFKFGKSPNDSDMVTVTGTVYGTYAMFQFTSNQLSRPVKNWYSTVLVSSNENYVSQAHGLITIRNDPSVGSGSLSFTRAIYGPTYGPFTGSFAGWPFVTNGLFSSVTNSLYLQIQSNDTDIASNLLQIQSNDTDISSLTLQVQSNDTDIASHLLQIQSNDTQLAEYVTHTNDTSDPHGTLLTQTTITGTDWIQFNTNFSNGNAEGRLQWNIDDGTLEYGLSGGNVNLQIGQEIVYLAKNVQGVTITNGQPVAIVTGTGNRPSVVLADADAGNPTNIFDGLATEDIANNQSGYITVFGAVRGIDTTGLGSEGDQLYLSTTAGQLTNVEPSAPTDANVVGTIVNSHASQGVIMVKPFASKHWADLDARYVNVTGDTMSGDLNMSGTASVTNLNSLRLSTSGQGVIRPDNESGAIYIAADGGTDYGAGPTLQGAYISLVDDDLADPDLTLSAGSGGANEGDIAFYSGGAKNMELGSDGNLNMMGNSITNVAASSIEFVGGETISAAKVVIWDGHAAEIAALEAATNTLTAGKIDVLDGIGTNLTLYPSTDALSAVTATGAGDAGANGVYVDTGNDKNGENIYSNGTVFLFYVTIPAGSWVIDANTNITKRQDGDYWHLGNVQGLYTVENGSAPAPTITASGEGPALSVVSGGNADFGGNVDVDGDLGVAQMVMNDTEFGIPVITVQATDSNAVFAINVNDAGRLSIAKQGNYLGMQTHRSVLIGSNNDGLGIQDSVDSRNLTGVDTNFVPCKTGSLGADLIVEGNVQVRAMNGGAGDGGIMVGTNGGVNVFITNGIVNADTDVIIGGSSALVDSDIGSTVEAYDADIMKTDVATTVNALHQYASGPRIQDAIGITFGTDDDAYISWDASDYLNIASLNTVSPDYILFGDWSWIDFNNINLTNAVLANGTTVDGYLDWGTYYGSPAAILYNGGAGASWGWGLQAGEMQFYAATGDIGVNHFSWNRGGDLQAVGSSQLMRLYTGGMLEILGTNTANVGLKADYAIQANDLNGGGRVHIGGLPGSENSYGGVWIGTAAGTPTTGNYALLGSTAGKTCINATTGQEVDILVNNISELTVDASKVDLNGNTLTNVVLAAQTDLAQIIDNASIVTNSSGQLVAQAYSAYRLSSAYELEAYTTGSDLTTVFSSLSDGDIVVIGSGDYTIPLVNVACNTTFIGAGSKLTRIGTTDSQGFVFDNSVATTNYFKGFNMYRASGGASTAMLAPNAMRKWTFDDVEITDAAFSTGSIALLVAHATTELYVWNSIFTTISLTSSTLATFSLHKSDIGSITAGTYTADYGDLDVEDLEVHGYLDIDGTNATGRSIDAAEAAIFNSGHNGQVLIGLLPGDDGYGGIWLNANASSPAVGNYALLGNSAGNATLLNTPTGTDMEFRVNNTAEATLNATTFDLRDNNLTNVNLTADTTADGLTVNGTLSLATNRTHYLAVGADIDAFIASATCAAGDTVVLGSGTHTVSADIDIEKSITVRGIGQERTLLSSAASGALNVLNVLTDNVTIEDLSIESTGTSATEYPIFIDGTARDVLTNIVVRNVTATKSGSSAGYGILVRDSNLTIESCTLNGNGSSAGYGIFLHGVATAEVPVTHDILSSRITGNDGGLFSFAQSSTETNTVSVYNSVLTGTADYGVWSRGGDESNVKIYNSYLTGAIEDAHQSDTALLTLEGCILANNTVGGTVTYSGTLQANSIDGGGTVSFNSDIITNVAVLYASDDIVVADDMKITGADASLQIYDRGSPASAPWTFFNTGNALGLFLAATEYTFTSTYVDFKGNTLTNVVLAADVTSYRLAFDQTDYTGTDLVVTHNLGYQYVVSAVYNDDDQLIIPDEVTATDANTLTLDMTSFPAITGNVVVVSH